MRPALELAGRSLLVPRVQPEPLPIKEVRPAPCTQGCPAGINVKAYVSLIAEERFREALEVVRQRCPLPAICGRICHHPCERACLRRSVDEPIAIRALKRFVADLGGGAGPVPRSPGPRRESKVAVVGSGPAGLTAAWDLALAGYRVTVFEGNSDPGGMLRYGITAYRLPRDVLSAEIDTICRAGVEIRTGCRVGEDLELEELLERGYSATLFAVGAQLGKTLGIPGERPGSGVEDALAFLRRVNEGDHSPVRGRVVVIGGGSTAVEAARSALRLGAESVDILYRRYREELLADSEEIKAAEAEGIAFRFLVTPKRVVTENGSCRALECVRVGLGEPDASGRRSPITIPGSEFTVPADRVLAAVGQRADLEFLPADFVPRLTDRGLLVVEAATAMTPWQGVFAAGDAVSGPATVIEAIAAGHRAASSMRRFLEHGQPGVDDQRPERRAARELELPDTSPLEALRAQPEMSSVRPGREFAEVERPFSRAEAVAEARRCLRCGPCGECRICASSCRRRHVMMRIPGDREGETGRSVLLRAPAAIALNLDARDSTPARLLPSSRPRLLPEIGSSEGSVVDLLPVRARIDELFCRACGSCEEVCPFEAVSVSAADGRPERAVIEPALCRGCNLCVGVCPTGAARPTALSPVWWGSRLEDAFRPSRMLASSEVDPFVVLACQRRAGAVETALEQPGVHVEVIRFRCVGQIDAGMLIDLHRLGAKGVLVAGCSSERCRFGSGANLAAAQVERGRTLVELVGGRAQLIWSDWSRDRAGDPVEEPVLRMLSQSPASEDAERHSLSH